MRFVPPPRRRRARIRPAIVLVPAFSAILILVTLGMAITPGGVGSREPKIRVAANLEPDDALSLSIDATGGVTHGAARDREAWRAVSGHAGPLVVHVNPDLPAQDLATVLGDLGALGHEDVTLVPVP